MPLSFSNLKKKVKSAALPMVLGSMNPALGTVYNAASNALKNKANPYPIAPVTQPIQAKASSTPAPVSSVKKTTPTVNTTVKPTALPNGLTQQQINQGYSTIPGDFDPLTGKPKNPVYIPPSSKDTDTKNVTDKAKEKPTFTGIIFDLIQKASKGSENVQGAREALTKFQTATADKIADIRSDDIPLEFQQGRAQVVQQASAEKEAALQTGVQNALADQQQQLSALEAAAGLAQPIQSPYSNQVLDPQTGLPVAGGAATGSLTDAVNSIAQKVKNGTMGYDAGLAALSGYGQAGANALNTSLGPNFNVQQSNASAAAQEASTLQTGTLGGQLSKQAETVKEHMLTLKQAFDNIAGRTGIPIINRGINAVAQQLGSGALQSYNIALANVRDELAKILGGGASTDSSRATAAELLPDNMTPAQITAAIKTATELMDSKILEYTRTPQFNTNQSAGGTGGLYDF